MVLFGKRKKNEDTQNCSCDGKCNAESTTKSESKKIEISSVKILGSGCTKCNQLEVATKAALEKLGIDITAEHVTDFSEIAAYGVMSTPALVVDGKVLSYGKVLKVEEVVKIFQKAGSSSDR
jgi:small redox-active disulfide protein 2